MLTRFLGGKMNRNSNIIATVTVASVCSLAILAGCGGGGDGGTTNPSPSPSPTVSPSPVVSPSPSPSVSPSPGLSPKDEAIASNFLPNYVPDPATRYLHWANNKGLRVFIRPSVNNIVDNAPSSTISPAVAEDIVQQSLNNWSTATGNDFTFTFVDSAAQSDIEIVFVDALRTSNGGAGAGVGLTNFQFIFPDNSHPKVAELKKAVAQVIAAQGTDNLVDTTSHELGHSLGIQQHSPDSNDLLFATSLPPATITRRDLHTLFFMYYSTTATGRAAHVTAGTPKVYTGEIKLDLAELENSVCLKRYAEFFFYSSHFL